MTGFKDVCHKCGIFKRCYRVDGKSICDEDYKKQLGIPKKRSSY